MRTILSLLSLWVLFAQSVLATSLVRCEHRGPDGRIQVDVSLWRCCDQCCGKKHPDACPGQAEGDRACGDQGCVDTAGTSPEFEKTSPQAPPSFTGTCPSTPLEIAARLPRPESPDSRRLPGYLDDPPLFLTYCTFRI